MKHYKLTYQQPYEYDDDSPSGIGDHGIYYLQSRATVDASNDDEARDAVAKFLSEGGVQFGFYPGSPQPGYYPRKFISLVETFPDRVIDFNYSASNQEGVQ